MRNAAAKLAVVSETPRLDAELLMAHALGLSRSDMLLRQSDLVVPKDFAGLLARRMSDEPVAYITGIQDFWDLSLNVTADVLIPRGDSETLIDAAVEAFAKAGPERILDLGTGSGALLLAALSAFPGAVGTGVDASVSALAVAQGNAGALGFEHRSTWLHLDWRDAGWTRGLAGPFNLILCNPPYIETGAPLSPMVAEYEPRSALFSGPEGLDDYRILLPQIPALLAPNGTAIFEIGHEQADAVSDLAANAGLSCELRRDLAKKPRALLMWATG